MSRKANNQIKYIDLFAGAGGLSLGLHNAGFKGIFAIEKNKDAFCTLKHNLIDKEHHFIWPLWLEQTEHDIQNLVSEHADDLKAMQGNVDLVVGGPPCQGFSMAGQRNHKDIRNTMVNYYLKVVEMVRPTYLLLENVHGFTVKFKGDERKRPYSAIVVEALEKLGYQIKTKEIKMSEYGVPQNRIRFIMVGSLKHNLDQFFIKLDNNATEFLALKGLTRTTTISEAIGDLLKSNGTIKCPDCSQSFLSGIYGKAESNYQKLMRESEYEYPNSHRFAKHTPDIEEMQTYLLKNGPVGMRITPNDNLIPKLKRRGVTLLDANKQAPTITSHPDDFVHYAEPRIPTVRENARLQSFPDWYEFCGKYTTGGKLRKLDVPRYTQVGNAVPPLFAEQIGNVFKEIINESKA